MKYNQPYGISDPNAGYINGNPATGTQGSIPPAESIEYPQREIVALVGKSAMAPSNSDLTQLAKAVQNSRVQYAVDTGSLNAMSAVFDPPITAYTLGMTIRVQQNIANINDASHLTLTLNAGAGSANVRLNDGTIPATAALKAGGIYEYTFDGTNWQMTNFGGAGGGAPTTTFINIPYVADSSGVANTVTANFSPAITTLTAGTTIEVRIANDNSGPTNITVNANPSKSIRNVDGTTLLGKSLVAGQIALLVYDGTNFQLLSVSAAAAKNKKFFAGKSGGLQNFATGSTWLDVIFDTYTQPAFGTFNGVTFTFSQAGTYMIFSGVYNGISCSGANYIHTAGNFIYNGLGAPGYGDAQNFASSGGSYKLISWGFVVVEANVGDTLKVQSSVGSTGFVGGTVEPSSSTLLGIARMGV